MGYEALLFCPDEKLARVVTQVFADLDFTVESVGEPFSAVKKLMAKRYDALVVDCENEQNAALLFKSGRNSAVNQKALALALVEGQAGVAKAYRIGANLVLTKPINVEQAKGTLRVARGLLRKNAEASPASPSATTGPSQPTAKPAPATEPLAFAASRPASPLPTPPTPQRTFEAPEFEPAVPVVAASAAAPEILKAAPAPEPQPGVVFVAEPPVPAIVVPASPRAEAFAMLSPSQPHAQASAAAPAPAKEVPPAAPVVQPEPKVEAAAIPVHELSVGLSSAPTFAALDSNAATEDSGGSKKIIAIAAVLILAAALGYFGWSKFGKTTAAQPSATAGSPQPVSTPLISAPAQTTASAGLPAASTNPAALSATQSAKPPANSAVADSRISVESETEPTKPEPAPIRVKSNPPAVKSPVVTDEAAPQAPSLGASLGTNKDLALVASAPTTMPKIAPDSLKISQGVSQGLLIKRVQPVYPKNAIGMRVEGAVLLEATIDKEGHVTNIKSLKGDPVLARAAADAVRQWRYKPYFLDGQPVEIQTQITVNFKLPN